MVTMMMMMVAVMAMMVKVMIRPCALMWHQTNACAIFHSTQETTAVSASKEKLKKVVWARTMQAASRCHSEPLFDATPGPYFIR